MHLPQLSDSESDDGRPIPGEKVLSTAENLATPCISFLVIGVRAVIDTEYGRILVVLTLISLKPAFRSAFFAVSTAWNAGSLVRYTYQYFVSTGYWDIRVGETLIKSMRPWAKALEVEDAILDGVI